MEWTQDDDVMIDIWNNCPDFSHRLIYVRGQRAATSQVNARSPASSRTQPTPYGNSNASYTPFRQSGAQHASKVPIKRLDIIRRKCARLTGNHPLPEIRSVTSSVEVPSEGKPEPTQCFCSSCPLPAICFVCVALSGLSLP